VTIYRESGEERCVSQHCSEVSYRFFGVLLAFLTWNWAVASQGVIVSVPGDYPSIAAAVLGAPDGATIEVGSGTYEFVDAQNLGKNLTIVAVSGPDATVISGGNSSRLLRVENALGFGNLEKNLVFIGFTFREGVGIQGSASPVTIARARPVFIDCVFENNRAIDKGGAVLVFGAESHPVFLDCIFRNNQSDWYGGAALINGGHAQATFKRCRFEGNTTRTLGTSNLSQGGALKFSEAGGRVIDSIFIGNSTAYSGGAIMLLNQFTASQEDIIEIRNCIFEGNFARPVPGALPAVPPPSEGGALMIEDYVHAIVAGSYFTNNVAASGGGIMLYRSRMMLEDCVLDGNIADGQNRLGFGGAIGVNSFDNGAPNRPEARVWLRDVMIRNNRAPVGGGIYAAGDSYWGLDLVNRGNLFMNRVVIDNNVSTTAFNSYGNGGGIFLSLMNATGTNVYILNNRAELYGGAMVLTANTSLALYDSFIVGNHADIADSEIHGPDNPMPILANVVRDFNGVEVGVELSHLAAIPSNAFNESVYVAYLNLPYGSPTLNDLIDLPNNRGYSAGTVRVPVSTLSDTLTLRSQFDEVSIQTGLGYLGTRPPFFGDSPIFLPAVIEAERYDLGGSFLAYMDRSLPNIGGAYRITESVDVSASGSASSGYYVSFIEAGEWLEYTFYSPGITVRPKVRVAADGSTGAFSLTIRGEPLSPRVVAIPNTGGWESWHEISLPIVSIGEGFQTVRFTAIRGNFNFDAIELLEPAVMEHSAWDDGYISLGEGWRNLTWFGIYIPMGGGWIWHIIHGFYFILPGSTPTSIWFYADDMGWMWASRDSWPWFYRANDASWLWYVPSSSTPRFFWNSNLSEWEARDP
jgi:hypothetical protein